MKPTGLNLVQDFVGRLVTAQPLLQPDRDKQGRWLPGNSRRFRKGNQWRFYSLIVHENGTFRKVLMRPVSLSHLRVPGVELAPTISPAQTAKPQAVQNGVTAPFVG